MRSRSILALWLVAFFAICCLRTLIADDDTGETARQDAIELIVFPHGSPARIDAQFKIDNVSISEIWTDTFSKLHKYCDRDGDGALSNAESQRAPTSYGLRQVAWGQLALQAGRFIPFDEADSDRDGAISVGELASYYRHEGLGNAIVGAGKGNIDALLTNALLKQIDVNHDGETNQGEWQTASKLLESLDSNGDGLLGPGELIAQLTYPGANGTILLKPIARAAPRSPSDEFVFALLSQQKDDFSWGALVNANRAKLSLQPLEESNLREMLEEAPTFKLSVSLDSKSDQQSTIESTPPIQIEKCRMSLATQQGKLSEQLAATTKQFKDGFAGADTNRDAIVDAKELEGPNLAFLKDLLFFADLNDDSNFTQAELTVFLELQQQIAKSHVVLTILDQGSGLFELLDTDCDASLSSRELRNAWRRIESEGCTQEEKFVRDRLPYQIRMIASLGRPVMLMGKPKRTGPGWFLAMDRNNDGEVSKGEFIGEPAHFLTIDADHNDFIDDIEAIGRKQ